MSPATGLGNIGNNMCFREFVYCPFATAFWRIFCPRNRAFDVLDTLEDAYYNKVKFIDGIVPPASYAAFMDASPRYLSTSHQCDLNKQLRIIRGGCSTRLPGYDSVECYRYLLEYKMALESAKYTESEIMKDLVENVSQLDKTSHSFDEWKNAMDRHRSQMVAARMNKESIF